MKKTILMIVVFCISILLLLIYFSDSSNEEDTLEVEKDSSEITKVEKNITKTKVSKIINEVPEASKKGNQFNKSNKPNNNSKDITKEKVLTEAELEEMEEYFDRIEADWSERIESLFIKELGLNEDDLKDYKKMRDGYEEDKLEAFQEFHEQMVEKYGDNYSYRPTPDQEQFENKVKNEYLDKLRLKLGDQNYMRYLEELDGFNERAKREQDPYKGIMFIDF